MKELQLFSNPEFGAVRAVDIDGEPWLVGKDVAQVLGYNDTDQALRKHVDDEDKLTRQIDGSGQGRSMTIINESGLYALALSSKLPGARKFRRWVTAEVLPAIRRTGGYDIPKDYLSALRALAESMERRLQLEAENEANRPKVLFADAVSAAKTSILVGELAKLHHDGPALQGAGAGTVAGPVCLYPAAERLCQEKRGPRPSGCPSKENGRAGRIRRRRGRNGRYHQPGRQRIFR